MPAGEDVSFVKKFDFALQNEGNILSFEILARTVSKRNIGVRKSRRNPTQELSRL